MPKFTKNFKQLNKSDTGIAGGKGASLGEMTNSGISVPPGFVVLACSFDQFIAKTHLEPEIESALAEVNHEDINLVEVASVKIRELIAEAKFPTDIAQEITFAFSNLDAKLVAVRSSATAEDSSVASWAGELESYLNVTDKNLLDSVKKCWSSLFTPRAIFYRFEKKLHKQKVSVAVVVQKMVQSEVSGICFTVHPVTEDWKQMVIEAGWGLGEAIVGGQITPDTYIINKVKNQKSKVKIEDDFEIIDQNISEQKMMIVRDLDGTTKETDVLKSKINQQKLSNENILKLAKLCQRIETHYSKPQDIEWALENDKFYIVQSRPITTLN